MWTPCCRYFKTCCSALSIPCRLQELPTSAQRFAMYQRWYSSSVSSASYLCFSLAFLLWQVKSGNELENGGWAPPSAKFIFALLHCFFCATSILLSMLTVLMAPKRCLVSWRPAGCLVPYHCAIYVAAGVRPAASACSAQLLHSGFGAYHRPQHPSSTNSSPTGCLVAWRLGSCLVLDI